MIILVIHWAAAVTLIGGFAFYYLVYGPSLKNNPKGTGGDHQINFIENRFKTLRWLSIATLLGTGIFNLLREGDSARMTSEYGVVLMIKLFIAILVAGLMGIQDFIIWPKENDIRPTEKVSPPEEAYRPPMVLGLIIFSLTLFVGLIAVYLSRM